MPNLKKPKIEMYWTQQYGDASYWVNWRLVGANGEIMCQSTQGFRDKTDAQRSIDACASYLFNSGFPVDNPLKVKIVGPGRKPK